MTKESLIQKLNGIRADLETGPTSQSKVMQGWDKARELLRHDQSSDHPRMVWESYIDSITEELDEVITALGGASTRKDEDRASAADVTSPANPSEISDNTLPRDYLSLNAIDDIYEAMNREISKYDILKITHFIEPYLRTTEPVNDPHKSDRIQGAIADELGSFHGNKAALARDIYNRILPYFQTPMPVSGKEYQNCSGSGCNARFEVTSDTAFYCKDCQASLKGNRHVD